MQKKHHSEEIFVDLVRPRPVGDYTPRLTDESLPQHRVLQQQPARGQAPPVKNTRLFALDSSHHMLELPLSNGVEVLL